MIAPTRGEPDAAKRIAGREAVDRRIAGDAPEIPLPDIGRGRPEAARQARPRDGA
jgi:hypothetical protein